MKRKQLAQYLDAVSPGSAKKLMTEPQLEQFAKKLEPKNKSAVALGRKGGKVKSEAKAKSSQENGKKGGRPVTWNSSVAEKDIALLKSGVIRLALEKDALLDAAKLVLSASALGGHPLDLAVKALDETIKLVEAAQ